MSRIVWTDQHYNGTLSAYGAEGTDPVTGLAFIAHDDGDKFQFDVYESWDSVANVELPIGSHRDLAHADEPPIKGLANLNATKAAAQKWADTYTSIDEAV